MERGGVAGAVRRWEGGVFWLVIVVRAGSGFVQGRLAAAKVLLLACLLSQSQGQGQIVGRRQGSLHLSVMLQPVGACVALLCFDGGGWPRAGMMHRARHSVYCCCRLNSMSLAWVCVVWYSIQGGRRNNNRRKQEKGAQEYLWQIPSEYGKTSDNPLHRCQHDPYGRISLRAVCLGRTLSPATSHVLVKEDGPGLA